MSEYSILIEDNSKIFLVKKISFDKKKRKLIISKYKQDKSYEVPAKDIVLDEIKLEGKKVDKLEIQFSHVDFWSFLIKEYNILSIEDFITSAIEYYNIKNYDHLNIFLESFNSDFTYYKVVDKDKVYLNPKDIVSKILNNLDIKKQKEMDKALIILQVEINTKVNSKMGNQVDKALIHGQMGKKM